MHTRLTRAPGRLATLVAAGVMMAGGLLSMTMTAPALATTGAPYAHGATGTITVSKQLPMRNGLQAGPRSGSGGSPTIYRPHCHRHYRSHRCRHQPVPYM